MDVPLSMIQGQYVDLQDGSRKLGALLRQHVLLSVFVLLGAAYISRIILSKLIIHLAEIFTGIWLAILLFVVLVIKTTDVNKELLKERKRNPLGDFSHLAFVQDNSWSKELNQLSHDKRLPEPVFPESFVLSDLIDGILENIQRDFILTWYRSFSSDSLFPSQVDSSLRYAAKTLGERIAKVDWNVLLARRLLPLITSHFAEFVAADSLVRQKSLELTESRQLNYAIAQECSKRRGLHPAVSLKVFDYSEFKKRWLQKRCATFLPYLLKPEDVKSKLTVALIGDVLSGAVLFPVLSMISDPDFWTQIITRTAGSALQDQHQVEKIRKALEEHTTRFSSDSKSFKMQRLSPNADQAQYEKFIRSIEKCESLAQARQTRYYISVQLKRTQQEGTTQKQYLRRLQMAKIRIDKRIGELSGTMQPSNGKDHLAGSEKDPREDYGISDILMDPACSLVFMEFMDLHKKTVLLQYCLIVNSLKDPLDDNFDEVVDLNEDVSDYAVDPLGGLEVVAAEEPEPANLDTNSTNDILQIYETYFKEEETRRVLEISLEEYQAVQAFVNLEDHNNLASYSKAKKAIFLTQRHVFSSIEQRDLAKFKKSDLFLKFLASSVPPPQPAPTNNSSSVDDLQIDNVDQEDVVDSKTVDAIEEALNYIMNGESIPNEGVGIGMDSRIKSNVSLASDEKRPKAKKLFDSDDDSEDEEPEEAEFITKESTAKVHQAAPGDLNLTEAIKILTEEIDQLYSQESVVESLLKKAELTNNTGQLRILRKSLSSLEREIHLKELQRQQYIVQESENSLYGCTDVMIQSYISGYDNNGEYTLYVIELQKYSSAAKASGDFTTSWVVARRYSQFLQLHQHLRSNFSEVNNLSFPKKRVLRFHQKALLDNRRKGLETYLRELLNLPDVCRSKALRLFLSSQTFSVDSLKGARDDLTNFASFEKGLSTTNTASDDISASIGSQGGLGDEGGVNEVEEIIISEESSKLYVQPVCDIFIELFGLNTGNNWLRGRAVVVLLQQLLGGAVEKRLRDVVSTYTTASFATQLLTQVRDSIWPGGQLKQASAPRTTDEKSATKRDAMILLHKLFKENVGKVLGNSSAYYASKHLFDMCQNEFLNAHLSYTLLDVILADLFPEDE